MSNHNFKQLRRRLHEQSVVLQQTQTGLCIIADLLLEKGVYTVPELQAFIAKKQAEAQAAQNPQPPAVERPCAVPATSLPPSSTPTTA